MKYTAYSFSLILLIAGCSTLQQQHVSNAVELPDPSVSCFNLYSLSESDKGLARDLLWEALNDVGIYTILDTLKAVSDVKSFRMPAVEVYGDSIVAKKVENDIDLYQYHRVAAALECGSIQFLITPFASLFEGERYYQVRVVNNKVLSTVLNDYPDFWKNWGFTQGSTAETIITVVEYEKRLNRYRGYGYLYGYPPHAVDFFVEAARQQSETGVFVTRDFFQIPTYDRDTGTFVYAVPSGHVPTPVDLQLKERAMATLGRYRELRADSTFEQPEDLIRYWLFTHTSTGGS